MQFRHCDTVLAYWGKVQARCTNAFEVRAEEESCGLILSTFTSHNSASMSDMYSAVNSTRQDNTQLAPCRLLIIYRKVTVMMITL